MGKGAWFGLGFGVALIVTGIINVVAAWGAYNVREFASSAGLLTMGVAEAVVGLIITAASALIIRLRKKQ